MTDRIKKDIIKATRDETGERRTSERERKRERGGENKDIELLFITPVHIIYTNIINNYVELLYVNNKH